MTDLVRAFTLKHQATSGPSQVFAVISGSTDGMSSIPWNLPIGGDGNGATICTWGATAWHDFNHVSDAGSTGKGVLNLLAVVESAWRSGSTARGIVGPLDRTLDLRGARFRVAIRPRNLFLPKRGQLLFWLQTVDSRSNLGLGSNVNVIQLMNPICEQLGFLTPYERPDSGQMLSSATPIWCEVPLTCDDLDWEMLGGRASRVAGPQLEPGKDYGVSLAIRHTLKRWTTNFGLVMFYPGTTPPDIANRIQGQFDIYAMELWVDPALNPGLALAA